MKCVWCQRFRQAPANRSIHQSTHFAVHERQLKRGRAAVAHAIQCEEYDVVLFSTTEQSNQRQKSSSTGGEALAIGCVTGVSAKGGVAIISIEELTRDDEADNRPGCTTWVEVGCEHVVPLVSVMRVLEADFSQRMDTDRVANPHGEHAHSIWELSENVDLSQETPANFGRGSEL